MVTTRTLANGVRVIVKRMEGLLSVTMGVLVGTGAAYETDEEDGISHFIEHMQFKGTDKHTAFGLSDAFDALGAQVNAFTGKDMTCFYAKSTSDHAEEEGRLCFVPVEDVEDLFDLLRPPIDVEHERNAVFAVALVIDAVLHAGSGARGGQKADRPHGKHDTDKKEICSRRPRERTTKTP